MRRAKRDRGWSYRPRRKLIGGALAAGIVILPLITTKGAAQGAAPTSYSVLYNFSGGADGGTALAGLIRDGAGNLYGTTEWGGNLSYCGGVGCGVVFKLDPSGKYTVLHAFTGADGENPAAGLVADGAGNLYGTTWVGAGVVFKLDPSGKYTVLHAFTGGADGKTPYAGLIRDPDGNLYGTTVEGGNFSYCPGYGCGVVFKLDPAGNETVLHYFKGADGANPSGGLIRDPDGNLYGTTEEGGNLSYCSGYGCGVVFKLGPAGNETVLYAFSGADGSSPVAGLVRDAADNLYGTTVNGGAAGWGVVFRLDPAGNETVLHSFNGETDGSDPFGSLILDAAGNLGGTNRLVVFRVDQKGNETVLYQFCSQPGCVDGTSSVAGLVRDREGNAYGTTENGGAYGGGVVFKLSPP